MDQDNNFLDENFGPKRVPTFLKVLCIISFIVGGIMLLYTVFSLASFDPELVEAKFEEQIYQLDQMPDNPFKDMMIEQGRVSIDEQIEHHTTLSIISIISILISLLGTILMFRLKKIGFHLYVVSKLIGLSQILFLTMNTLAILELVIFGIFTLAFIIMYAVNLKHMS